MLTLSRRKDEVIHIGDDVRVIVHKIKGRSVSLSIEAPKAVKIDRGEVRARLNPGPQNCRPDVSC